MVQGVIETFISSTINSLKNHTKSNTNKNLKKYIQIYNCWLIYLFHTHTYIYDMSTKRRQIINIHNSTVFSADFETE